MSMNTAATKPSPWRAAGAVAPGVAITAALGALALASKRVCPSLAAVSDVLVALAAGALVANTPLGTWIGLNRADGQPSRFVPGLDFVGKKLLRASVVLMGLRIEAHLFGSARLATIAIAILTALPVTFFLTHALAVPLRVPRALADLVAAGTMICGASAVNAVAPVIRARRQEQGIALATVFLFSAVALVSFRFVAAAVHLPIADAGIWSGLSVNDLASAVSVGASMGPGGAEMAAASKSARIMTLAPMLVVFALLRAVGAARGEVRRSAARHIPLFVLGFVALVGVRAGADALFGNAPAWRAVLAANGRVVEIVTVMVSAGIGLHLKLRGLAAAGGRAVVLGAVAASTTAGVTLLIVTFAERGAYSALAITSATAITAALSAYRIARAADPRPAKARTTTGGHLLPVTGEYPAA
jgi:uncharacterized integral membrane protein (TIGR00698 family)